MIDNSFYKVIKITEKMFYTKKMKTQTELIKTWTDEDLSVVNTYKAQIFEEFEPDVKEKKIRKTDINNYPIIYTRIVQYDV